METEKDRELWRIAKKRVGFKRHLGTYVIINTMFWLVWLFTDEKDQSFPWPVWPMLGWGIGLAFNFLEAYVNTKSDAIEREFEKLKNK
jgi:2TM domain-containing protein